MATVVLIGLLEFAAQRLPWTTKGHEGPYANGTILHERRNIYGVHTGILDRRQAGASGSPVWSTPVMNSTPISIPPPASTPPTRPDPSLESSSASPTSEVPSRTPSASEQPTVSVGADPTSTSSRGQFTVMFTTGGYIPTEKTTSR